MNLTDTPAPESTPVQNDETGAPATDEISEQQLEQIAGGKTDRYL